jgi:hypothetical protein
MDNDYSDAYSMKPEQKYSSSKYCNKRSIQNFNMQNRGNAVSNHKRIASELKKKTDYKNVFYRSNTNNYNDASFQAGSG